MSTLGRQIQISSGWRIIVCDSPVGDDFEVVGVECWCDVDGAIIPFIPDPHRLDVAGLVSVIDLVREGRFVGQVRLPESKTTWTNEEGDSWDQAIQLRIAAFERARSPSCDAPKSQPGLAPKAWPADEDDGH